MQFSVLIDEGQGILDAIREGAEPLIQELTFGIEREMKESMAAPKHGAIRRRDGHQASAKGEAPAIDTGFLLNSIQTEMQSPTFGLVTVSAEYGWILDTLRERPFVEPAIDKAIQGVG